MCKSVNVYVVCTMHKVVSFVSMLLVKTFKFINQLLSICEMQFIATIGENKGEQSSLQIVRKA